MFRIRALIAILFCRMTKFALRILGKAGTSFPGRIAVKICPNLLELLSKNVKVIMVTGTNGKTTSSRIVEAGLSEAGVRYFANRSGANLICGITACFVMNSTWTGKNKKDYAVIECDEAALKTVSLYVKPQVLICTNIFRDQLDRFGEITHTLASIQTGISHLPNTILCLNGDCSLTYSLAEKFPDNKTVIFGVDQEIYQVRAEEVSDAKYCIRCKHEYEYDYTTFAHLGAYKCPNCGYHRPMPDVSAKKIIRMTPDVSEITLRLFDRETDLTINLPGGYNIYNACGAAAALSCAGFPDEIIYRALKNFSAGFGRMEKMKLGESNVRMILVKNPAGCNQVINFLTAGTEDAVFYIALNDKDSDGTDVSWIWDVEFEKLLTMQNRLTRLVVSGIRRYEMALRLKYAGFSEDFIEIKDTFDEFLDAAEKETLPVYMMPTYTAMLTLRKMISTRYGIKQFWE